METTWLNGRPQSETWITPQILFLLSLYSFGPGKEKR